MSRVGRPPRPAPDLQTCVVCSTELGRRNKSGLCRPCLGRKNLGTPEARQRAAAGIRRYLADPVARKAHAARSQEQLRAWRATPEGAAKLVEQAHANLANAYNPESEQKRIHSIRAAVWAGIPEHRWDEAVALSKSFNAAEARRMILEDEAAIERKRLAAMTPFERQMAKVAAGARVIPVFKPTTGHAFTLGGVATGMI